MVIALRKYQVDAVDALEAFWAGGGFAGLAVLGTGLGKSFVAAEIGRRGAANSPASKTICICPTKELVLQNVEAARKVWPEAGISIHCEGLGRRDTEGAYIVATMQSLHSTGPAAFGTIARVVADEAHLVTIENGDDQVAMYRTFIADCHVTNEDLVVAGLTATPYRMGHGAIDDGDGVLFEPTVYRFGYLDALNSGSGLVVPLIPKRAKAQIDTSGIPVAKGDFAQRKLSNRATRPNVISAACAEIVENGHLRASWIIYCINHEHADLAAAELRRRGIRLAIVKDNTRPRQREEIVAAFRSGTIQCLINVDIFVLGFDIDRVDLIAILRPTLSFPRYWQMKGRGVRPFSGKSDCLVLDFGGNAARHGLLEDPLDRAARIGGVGIGPNADQTWACEICSVENPSSRIVCTSPGCGGLRPTLHSAEADTEDLLPGWRICVKFVNNMIFKVEAGADIIGGEVLRIDFEHPDGTISIQRLMLSAPMGSKYRASAEAAWRSFDTMIPASVGDALGRFLDGNIAKPEAIEARFGPSAYGLVSFVPHHSRAQ